MRFDEPGSPGSGSVREHPGAGRDRLNEPLPPPQPGRMLMPVEDLQARLAAALAGRYTIEREIGRGGMSLVYLARDLRNERRVALKVLRPDLRSEERRVGKACRSRGAPSHPKRA